jgi:hypothetical protein
MKTFKNFTKSHFEYELKGILIRNKLGLMKEIELEGTFERVYEVSTKNKAVSIIIFSSVNQNNNQMRDKDSDCVRVVLKWTTKYGEVFQRVGKHYRLETLFNNLEKTLLNVNPFNLEFKKFSKEMV